MTQDTPNDRSALPPSAVHVAKLGPALCWAIVYADIGTSIYYVPGILREDVGSSAASFVLGTSLAFVLLARKYAEIAARYPSGGGVVSVAGEAFGPRTGALGGMLILVDYFLTAAISAVAGFEYLATLVPAIEPLVLPCAVSGLALLALLNWVGIRESAALSGVFAAAAFGVLVVLLASAGASADAATWGRIGSSFAHAGRIPLGDAAVGFAGAWLAFSGLESLSQISPAMRDPRRRTAGLAMAFVVGALLLTAPLLTAFATNTIDPGIANDAALQSDLAFAVGGAPLRALVVVTASALLVFAANTAIVGAYHVIGALGDGRFLPDRLLRRSHRFGTPGVAIVVSALVPITVLLATRGRIDLLAGLYAFGLLGAFSLSSLSLDRVRIAEGRLGFEFALGVATTLVVLVAWLTNLVAKPAATAFGGGLTTLLWGYALLHRRRFRGRRAGPVVAVETAEAIAGELPAAARILTLGEAEALEPAYSTRTLACIRGPNDHLLDEVATHLKGSGQWTVAVIYVDEVPGLFVPRDTEPSEEARAALGAAVEWFDARGYEALPIWRIANDAGDAIADAARRLAVGAVFVGTSQRGRFWHLLRGSVIARLVAVAPTRTRIVIVG